MGGRWLSRMQRKLIAVPAMVAALRAALIGCAYLVTYVLLDWISFIEPFGSFGITPWNPTEGLSFAFGLLSGRAMLPLLVLAPLLAEVIVRSMPAPFSVLIGLSLATGGVYISAILLLKSARSRFDISLQRLSDVATLIGAGACCAGIASGLYVGLLVLGGHIAGRDFATAALRYWVGDAIGIMVTTPLVLALWSSPRKAPPLSLEMLAQLVLVEAALASIYATAGAPRIELFYLVFIPIIWMALRGGLLAVSFGLAVTQVLLIINIQMLAAGRVHVTPVQAMMLVLTLTGLAIGVVVDERRRAQERLRKLQATQAEITRVGSFNELSAALAHEINQPLTAATTYARVAVESLRSDDGRNSAARTAALKSMEQVQRAAEVVRRIRQLIRAGQVEPATIPVSRLVWDALDLAGLDRRASGIEVDVRIVPADLQVWADPLQVQQALLNLLRNAAEAIGERTDGPHLLRVRAVRGDPGEVEVIVEDTGPGFRSEVLERPFEPFHTTKVDGLGIGLSLCRTIIQANRGRVWIENTGEGAAVHFTLPKEPEVAGEEENLRRSD